MKKTKRKLMYLFEKNVRENCLFVHDENFKESISFFFFLFKFSFLWKFKSSELINSDDRESMKVLNYESIFLWFHWKNHNEIEADKWCQHLNQM